MSRFIAMAIAVTVMPLGGLQAQETPPAPEILQAPMAEVGKDVDTPDADEFARKASMSSLFEIEAARLATVRAVKADTSTFAQQVLNDQLKAQAELRRAAGQEGVKVATALDEPLQQKLRQLEEADDEQFDEVFYTTQLGAQEDSLQLLAAYGVNGDREALRAFAQAHFSTKKMALARAHAVTAREN